MWAATPGIHLRWLLGARVEFPYRERTMEVEFGTGGLRPMGDVVGPGWGRTGVVADAGRGGFGVVTVGCRGEWVSSSTGPVADGPGTSMARIASGANRSRQSFQD